MRQPSATAGCAGGSPERTSGTVLPAGVLTDVGDGSLGWGLLSTQEDFGLTDGSYVGTWDPRAAGRQLRECRRISG